jgi:hypothetical protein
VTSLIIRLGQTPLVEVGQAIDAGLQGRSGELILEYNESRLGGLVYVTNNYRGYEVRVRFDRENY